ncbi:MAG: PSP1 domain-containing protein [Eubacteriales bacterium]
MKKVAGIRFKNASKLYYFDPDGLELKQGMNVVVETARGIEYGKVVVQEKDFDETKLSTQLRKVIRIATEEDTQNFLQIYEDKANTIAACREIIEKQNLEMRLVDVEYAFDRSKLIFYFTADERVDFRDLVKKLASHFKMRIELRQVGIRDEAKMIGGIGNCGRCLCCSSWLTEFDPVSIKMAKVQNLSFNPAKISGICGRLMCCLKYENDLYLELRKGMPEVGEKVKIDNDFAIVVDLKIIDEKVSIRRLIPVKGEEDKLSDQIETFKKSEIKRLFTEKAKHKKDNDLEFENLDAEELDELRELMKD